MVDLSTMAQLESGTALEGTDIFYRDDWFIGSSLSSNTQKATHDQLKGWKN